MKYLYILFIFFFSTSLFSQKAGYKEYFMEGSYLLLEDEPDQALVNFQKAYKLDSSSANINYMLGISYMLSPTEKGKAEYHLAKAVQNISKKYKTDNASEKAAPPLAQFYYGKALHFNFKFEEAGKQFESFKTTVNPKDIEYVKMLDKEVSITKVAKQLTNFPLNVKITNLGENINSPYPDYSAVLSGDERTIIFTTRRPTNSGVKDLDGSDYEDIVVSYKDNKGNWSKPIPLGINTLGHEASINLSPDGQTLIVYKNEAGGKNPAGNGNLYYTEFDGKDWALLKEFGSDVNTLFLESHACLSSDGNVLFFSSERPGGYGGKDIYRCIKLPNGKWSKALNMGSNINTEYDEDGGFIHPDGQTFYFASNGPMSMGGYDILYATLNEDNKFTNVTNIGFPINTTDDDIFYVISPDAKRGYLASSKEGGLGDKDIYEITLEENRETFLALFKGQILPAEGESLPDNISIVVTDKGTNELVGIYRPKLLNGTFSTILPPGKEYNFSYQVNNGEEFYNEDIFVSNEYAYQEIKREVNLEPVKLVGKIKVVQNTIVLNMLVLNNVKDQKPVAGAKLVLQEENAGKQVFTTTGEGKFDGVLLSADKKYFIVAETEGKKSPAAEVSTFGVKAAKVVNEIVYMEAPPKAITSKELLLDLTVKHPKTKKGIANANVTLTDANGLKTELVTDEKGNLTGIELLPEMKYRVLAYKESSASEVETFTSGSADKPKRFTKNIPLLYNAPIVVQKAKRDTAEISASGINRFEFHYSYGQTTIDLNEESWKNYIDNLMVTLQEKAEVTVFITGSASKVPMRKAGGNPALAADRAAAFKALVEKTVAGRGGKVSKIKFSVSSGVTGPEYRGDYILSKSTYEKYQYVKSMVK